MVNLPQMRLPWIILVQTPSYCVSDSNGVKAFLGGGASQAENASQLIPLDRKHNLWFPGQRLIFFHFDFPQTRSGDSKPQPQACGESMHVFEPRPGNMISHLDRQAANGLPRTTYTLALLYSTFTPIASPDSDEISPTATGTPGLGVLQ